MSDAGDHGVTRRITRGALVNLSGDALDLLGLPLLYLFIGRVHGAAALGTYILVASYVAILLRLAVLGFDKAMLRFIPASGAAGAAGDAEEAALGTALRWATAAGIVLCAAAALFPGALLSVGGDPSAPQASSWLAIMALALPALSVSRVLLFAMRGRGVMWAFVVAQSVVAPLSLLAASALPALFGGGPAALPWGFVASAGITALVAFALFLREFSRLSLRSTLTSRRDAEMLRFSFPQGLSEAVNFVLARVDIIMIAAFFPERMELVAFYGVASLLAGVVKRVRIAFDNSFSPVFARHYADGDGGAMNRTYRETSSAITSLFVLVAGVLCFAAPGVLALYGPEYEALWIAVPVLVFGRLLNAAGGPAQAALLMSGRSGLELANNVVMCAVNVGLNLLLIPRFHVYGAAAASAITLTLFNLVRIVEIWHLMRIRTDLRSVTISLAFGVATAIPCAAVAVLAPVSVRAFVAAAVLFAATYVTLTARCRRDLDLRRLWIG